MLEIKPTCENCNKLLPNGSPEAMLCSFECTFCSNCVSELLYNVCPNCGGGFEKRPTRPTARLQKYPASTKDIYKPIDNKKFKLLLEKYRNISPAKR